MNQLIVRILILSFWVVAILPQDLPVLKDLQGQNMDIFKDNPSRLIVVNFWAVWCKPCVQEFPELNQLYLNLKSRGVSVVGVSISPSKEAILNFLEKHKVDFSICIDEHEEFADKFKVSVLPTTLLMDTKYNVLYKYQGFSRKEIVHLEKIIEEYLKK